VLTGFGVAGLSRMKVRDDSLNPGGNSDYVGWAR